MTGIDEYAFDSCTALASVTFGKGLEWIWDDAFCGCSALTDITIPAGVTEIGENPFYHCAGLKEIHVDKDNAAFASQDGVLFDKALAELICCPGGRAGDYTVPDSVTAIAAGAFSGNTNLTGVTVPESVTSIGEGAFSGCEGLTVRGYAGSCAEAYAKENGIPFETIAQGPVKGDYNGDAAVTVADAVLLARFISEDTALTSEQIAAILNHEPDFDGDGIVTIRDVSEMLKQLGTSQPA